MTDIYRLQSELEQKERELASMTTHVVKDVQWRPGVQDQSHSESYSYDQYSDPSRANALKRDIERLRKEIEDAPRMKAMEEEAKMSRDQQKFSGGVNSIISGAKQLYDSEMQAYMNKNFWGKAKAMLSGKKPKQMKGSEIVQTYGKGIVDAKLANAIEARRQVMESNIEMITRHYTEHPEELAELSEDSNTVGKMVQHEIRSFEADVERMRAGYTQMFDHAIKSVQEFGMKFFVPETSAGKSR